MNLTSKKILAGILISILLISIIYTTGCVEDQGNEQDEPEETMGTFVERINDEDSQGVMELGLSDFLDREVFEDEDVPITEEEFDEELDTFKKAIDEGEMEVDSYDIEEMRYLEEMDEENRTEFEGLMDTINNCDYFNAEVTDMSFIEFEWDTTVDEGSVLEDYRFGDLGDLSEELDWDLLLLEIDNEWYIPVPGTALALILYMGLDSFEPESVSGSIDAELEEGREGKEESNITVRFMSIGTPSTIELENLTVVIEGTSIDDTYIQNTDNWSFLTADEEVRSGSELVIREEHEYINLPNEPGSVEIYIDGYQGTLETEL